MPQDVEFPINTCAFAKVQKQRRLSTLMDISGTVGRFMAVIVLCAAALAFLVPDSGLWIRTGWINYLLMIVMFGMGLTIRPADFKVVFTRPKRVIIGYLAQFTIIPLAAYLLCKLFGLETGLIAGVILVGACPGGNRGCLRVSSCGRPRPGPPSG